MAWNAALPANNEKIRNLGTVIRPNWEALQQGDDVGVSGMLEMRSVQLDNRTGLAANNNPITNAGTHYLFSKNDSGGTQEGFAKDSAGNVIQFTNGGKIGSTSTSYEANSVRLTSLTFDGSVTYNANNLIRAWGIVASAGTSFVTNKGFPGTVTLEGAATYVITITGMAAGGGNFASADSYGTLVTPAFTSTGTAASVHTKTATSFKVNIVNAAGTATAAQFTIALTS